jgi:hypothetical protein
MCPSLGRYEVKTYQKLKGKTLAVDAVTSLTHTYAL